MSRSVRVTIKYFSICGLLIFVTFGSRPFLHFLEGSFSSFPFWIWDMEYPFCTLVNIGIVSFWGYQTYQRIIQKKQRKLCCAICYCMAGWLLGSLAYHTYFDASDPLMRVIQRLIWYFYYIPWMAIPLLFFYIALYVGKTDKDRMHPGWLLLWIPYGLINLGIMTNDLHQQAFAFPQGFDTWRLYYTHGWIYWVAYLWIFIVSVAAVAIIYWKSTVPSVSRFAILPMLTLGMGQILCQAVYYNLYDLRVAEVCILAFGSTMELCIRLNLIPNNVHYADFIRSPELQLYVYDDKWNLTHKPKENAVEIRMQQTPFMLDENNQVQSRKIFGGYAVWIEDQNAILRLRRELEEIQELLKEESFLIREENELNKRKISVQVKRRLYDEISAFADKYAWELHKNLEKNLSDAEHRGLVVMCLKMAYIKRRANMMLLTSESDKLALAELYNAVFEPMSFLEYLGISALTTGRLSGWEDGSRVMESYDMFWDCLLRVYDSLSAIMVRFSEEKGEAGRVFIRIMMNLKSELSDEEMGTLRDDITGLSVSHPMIVPDVDLSEEDGTIYLVLAFRKGGSR